MKPLIDSLAKQLNIPSKGVEAVLELLADGATIPFIARYRKEKTGNLDEDQIKAIEEQYRYLENLQKRKEDVIRLIEEKGMLNDVLKEKILACEKLSEIEDLYRPYKEKKKTKASQAIAAGFEPLAQAILKFDSSVSLEKLAQEYIHDEFDTSQKALEQAGYIIAEQISDNASYRKWIRSYIQKNGQIASSLKKDAQDETKVYSNYYDYSQNINTIPHFRVLALNRGENEKILNVSLEFDTEPVEAYLTKRIVKKSASQESRQFMDKVIKDALKRLIYPSIKREIRSDLTQKSDELAIKTFQTNLEHLLMSPPIKQTRVLGFDPAFRTGCKLAVLDSNGTMLTTAVIYPTAPHNDFEKSKKTLLSLIDQYKISLIAIGNGTASRESEAFVAKCIKERPGVQYTIVSEAGASVYSASTLAQEEFPELTVEKRSAISIGRRIQDPLSELVKIDPKSIGIGEYQHDVNQKKLNEALDFTTEKIVNEVGVNVNTASKSILKFVSGLNKSSIEKLYTYKETHPISSRSDIAGIKGISAKAYEQCIGFLRIPTSDNPLDNTGIHPESYALCHKMLKMLRLDLKDIGTPAFVSKLKSQHASDLAQALDSDTYTISDMIKELITPGLDPRDSLDAPVLRSDVLSLEDLKPGMEMQGTVRNVTSFGAFIDIGLHEDGLVHVSKMSKRFVSNPNDVVHVGQVVTCYVLNTDLERKRVQLSLLPC
jgi:uncharacterized protein